MTQILSDLRKEASAIVAGTGSTAVVPLSREIIAGAGLSGGGDLGSDVTLSLTAPGSLSAASSNAASGNHTHAVVASADPGATAQLLKTTDAGLLNLQLLAVTGNVTLGGELLHSGDLTIKPTGGNVFIEDAALQSDDWVNGSVGWGIQANGTADFRTLTVDELIASTFTNDINLALAGTEIITKSLAIVSRDFTVAASGTLYVYDLPGAPDTAVFENGDWVRLRYYDAASGLAIEDCWGTVSSYTNLTDGEQSWTWTKQSGTNGRVIRSGMLALDYGQSGDGFIKSTVQDSAGSPYIDVSTWETDPSDGANITTAVRLGNLAGTGVDGYGLAAGGSVVLNETGLLLTKPTTLVSIYGDADTRVGTIGMSGQGVRLLRSDIQPANLFVNGGFESATLTGWEDDGGSGTFARTATNPYEGDYGLQIEFYGDVVDPEPSWVQSPLVEITGAAANIRMAIRRGSTGSSAPNLSFIRFDWYDALFNFLPAATEFAGTVQDVITTDWREYEFLVAAPALAQYVRIRVGQTDGFGSGGWRSVVLDQIQVQNASSTIFSFLDVTETAVSTNKPLRLSEVAAPDYVEDHAQLYFRNDKLVVQYRDGSTTRYKYLALNGTGVTWVHTTTAP